MHRFVVLFVGCLGVALLLKIVGGFDCAVVVVVLGDTGPLLLSSSASWHLTHTLRLSHKYRYVRLLQ